MGNCWEYTVMRVPADITGQDVIMDRLGGEWWELVTVAQNGLHIKAYFKRAVKRSVVTEKETAAKKLKRGT